MHFYYKFVKLINIKETHQKVNISVNSMPFTAAAKVLLNILETINFTVLNLLKFKKYLSV